MMWLRQHISPSGSRRSGQGLCLAMPPHLTFFVGALASIVQAVDHFGRGRVPDQAETLAVGRIGFGKAAVSDPLLAQAARFAALPAFDAAVRAYIMSTTGFRRSNRLINK